MMLPLCALTAALGASPGRIRARADGFMVDEHGRARIFHGFNDIQRSKGSGHTPGGAAYLPPVLSNLDRLRDMEEQGFNGFRVPMMWAATRPAPNQTDGAYLSAVAKVVDNMADHNMYALLDMHQDCMVHPGGYDGAPEWVVNRSQPAHDYPWPFKQITGWNQNCLTEKVDKEFQDLYDNTYGGLDEWGAFWQAVAGTFRNQTAVLGYELINEPFPGNPYTDPLVLLPGVAGRKNLLPAYKAVAAAIRAHDTETALFFEPVTYGMIFPGDVLKVAGSGFDEAPDPNSVFSWHYYCWFAASGAGDAPYPTLTKAACDAALGPEVFRAVAADTARIRAPGMMTEWGGKTPNASLPDSLATQEMVAVLDLADAHFQSWTFYDLVSLEPHGARPGDAWIEDAAAVFARPFAQAVAGTPTLMRVDAAGTFRLEFRVDAAVAAPTEVAVPPLHFPRGFDVNVSAGLSWTMAPGRRNVVAVAVAADPAPPSGTVVIARR